MIDFLKSKWYYVVGVFVGVFFAWKLWQQAQSTTQAASAGGTSVTYTGGGSDSASQVATIQAQSANSIASIQAANNLQLAQLQEQATLSNNSTALQIAQAQYGSATDIATVQADAALKAALAATAGQTQSTIQQAYYADQTAETQAHYAYLTQQDVDASSLAAVQSTNAANVTINDQNTHAAVAMNQSDNDAATSQALALYNAELAAYGIQASVAKQAITSQQATAANNNSTLLAAQREANQASQTRLNSVNGLITYNLIKGGATGANQLAAIQTAIYPSSAGATGSNAAAVGIASQQADAAKQSAWAQFLSTVASAAFGTATAAQMKPTSKAA